MNRVVVWIGRVLMLAAFLLAWQYLPTIDSLSSNYAVFNRFLVSSPSDVFHKVIDFATGRSGTEMIWPELFITTRSAVFAFVFGMTSGAAMGLLLSNAPVTNEIVGFFIKVMNSVPRVVLIPIIILVVGTGPQSGVVAGTISVFFVTFFNAYQGGVSVPTAVVRSARVMSVAPFQVMRQIRLQYVLLWTFAAVPNALSHALFAVITTEVLGGTTGIGSVLLQATVTLDARTTMSVVMFVAVTGVTMLRLAELAKARLLHWAEEGEAR